MLRESSSVFRKHTERQTEMNVYAKFTLTVQGNFTNYSRSARVESKGMNVAKLNEL